MERKCLCCEKVLETDPHADKFGTTIGVVYGATIWRTHGNYGSTKFDPMGPPGSADEFLEAYVCDDCLTQKGAMIYHVEAQVKRTEEVQVQTYIEHELKRS